LGHVHLLGIAGVGVSAVARLLLADGLSVSGTDAKDLPVLRELEAAGARVHVGFDAAHIEGADTLVLSSVIKDGNPELEAARAKGLTILHRSEALAALMEGRTGITVAGTHGKTTTSSMIALMLREAGADPTFAIGAALPQLGTNAELGSGPAFVAEADESDGSFLNYRPRIAVVTNVRPITSTTTARPRPCMRPSTSTRACSRRTGCSWRVGTTTARAPSASTKVPSTNSRGVSAASSRVNGMTTTASRPRCSSR